MANFGQLVKADSECATRRNAEAGAEAWTEAVCGSLGYVVLAIILVSKEASPAGPILCSAVATSRRNNIITSTRHVVYCLQSNDRSVVAHTTELPIRPHTCSCTLEGQYFTRLPEASCALLVERTSHRGPTSTIQTG